MRQLKVVMNLWIMSNYELKDYDSKLNATDALPWEEWYEEMAAFRAAHGNCIVPHGYKTKSGHSLWHWAERVRRDYAEGKVTDEQFKKLDELHFIWDMEDLTWETGFAALQNYHDKHGDCVVPIGYRTKDHYPLGLWVATQRDFEGMYPRDKFHRLNALGYIWNMREYHWERAFAELKLYKETHGDCMVPKKYIVDGDLDLGEWVIKQRADLHFNFLPQDKLERLNDIGFSWAATEDSPLIVMIPKEEGEGAGAPSKD